jgi:hypothetical protein
MQNRKRHFCTCTRCMLLLLLVTVICAVSTSNSSQALLPYMLAVSPASLLCLAQLLLLLPTSPPLAEPGLPSAITATHSCMLCDRSPLV